MATLSCLNFPVRRAAVVATAVLVGSVLAASAALANHVARKSFDQQVVAADVFVMAVGVDDEALCPGGGRCTAVRVLQSLKGDAPAEIFLTDGGIAEQSPHCCEAGHVYAMALIRAPNGLYYSTNASMAVYDLGTAWPERSAAAEEPDVAAPFRRLTFDQQVVASDAFVVARGTGERHPCRGSVYGRECETFEVIRTMKGSVPQTFEAPTSLLNYDMRTRQSTTHDYGFGEGGQIYALALSTTDGELFQPLGVEAVHALAGP